MKKIKTMTDKEFNSKTQSKRHIRIFFNNQEPITIKDVIETETKGSMYRVWGEYKAKDILGFPKQYFYEYPLMHITAVHMYPKCYE